MGNPCVAEHAVPSEESERHDDHLAAPDRPDVAANLFDDADCFMAHTLTFDVRSTIVWPKIATADAGAGDADHGISRFDGPVASGTFSILTSPALCMTAARTLSLLRIAEISFVDAFNADDDRTGPIKN